MTNFQQASSVGGTLSDLDGFSVSGDHYYSTMQNHTPYAPPEIDDFGFDPPSGTRSAFPVKMEQGYSPPEDSIAGFDSFDHLKDDQISPTSDMPGIEIDRMIAQTLPNASTAVARYGQVTPPRSNSESSIPNKQSGEASPQVSERRKRSIRGKEEQATPPVTATGRKRRNTRKTSTAATGDPEEDDKRRQSLEKNRLAAAKCRVNKKEKTEQLQRDSHDKAVQNAFLKEQVMRMKEELQQMNALLLNHANCEGCKSPGDIQKHLNDLGNEFYAHHMSGMNAGPDFGGFPPLPVELSELDRDSVIHENYFSPDSDPNLMNPPLPDFDREPNFDVTTPMHTD